jgi:enoyl-CoA hydratase/carnithine racemase
MPVNIKQDGDELKYEVQGHIATITFNRPDKLNAFTRAMTMGLIQILDALDIDDNVRVIIVTGSGRAFCAGADLAASDSMLSKRQGERPLQGGPIRSDGSIDWTHDGVRDFGGRLTLRLFKCLKPVIVAFNGPAVGMGITMSLAADFRLASTASKFSLPFGRRGIAPESASSWFLPRIVGISQALEWTLTGRTFSAQEALHGRLVRSLHEPDELLPAAVTLATEIATNNAPVSIALTRQLMWRMLGADHPMHAHRIESRSVFSRGRSADMKEGVASFFAKRPPNFTNRVSVDLPDFFPWWIDEEYK